MRQQLGTLALVWSIAAITGAAMQAPPSVAIPQNATGLEGVPTISVTATKDGVVRTELDAAAAAKNRLAIRIVDGRYYLAGVDAQPLTMTTTGAFTYLSSTKPGRYVRFRRLGERLTYVEHVDLDLGSVTYWGELRIVLDK